MARLVMVTGVPKVLARLKASTVTKAIGIGRGLKMAGLFLQRESQLIVPIDLGNLKGTARTDSKGFGFDTDVIVHYGAGADYAVYVHEDLQAKHKPGKQAKYLERPVREKRGEMIKMIREEAKR